MQRPKLEPLEVTCSRSDCDNELHCFRKSRRESSFAPGQCQSCGADLIDWPRIQKRDLGDVQNTFESLRKEWIRHEYWHRQLDQRAINYAKRKGRIALYTALESRIRKSVGARTARDGRQTPWEGSPLYYAQHATACCCRRCMQYWHGLPAESVLTEGDVNYFVELCKKYLNERLPDLADAGIRVPPIRKRMFPR